MRIELDKSAIERLIGGDTEVEIKIRNQIVQEFARQHLKKVAEESSYKLVLEEVKSHVNKVIKEHFGIDNLVNTNVWPTIDSRLESMVESLVKKHAQEAVDEAVSLIIKYQKHYWGKEIQSAINKEIEIKIKEGIQKRLEDAAKL